MSAVNVPVPNNLLSIVDLLSTLAATEPLIADHVVPIIEQAFNYAMTSGKAKDPEVWVRALKAAIITIETLKADDTWLAMTPISEDFK